MRSWLTRFWLVGKNRNVKPENGYIPNTTSVGHQKNVSIYAGNDEDVKRHKDVCDQAFSLVLSLNQKESNEKQPFARRFDKPHMCAYNCYGDNFTNHQASESKLSFHQSMFVHCAEEKAISVRQCSVCKKAYVHESCFLSYWSLFSFAPANDVACPECFTEFFKKQYQQHLILRNMQKSPFLHDGSDCNFGRSLCSTCTTGPQNPCNMRCRICNVAMHSSCFLEHCHRVLGFRPFAELCAKCLPFSPPYILSATSRYDRDNKTQLTDFIADKLLCAPIPYHISKSKPNTSNAKPSRKSPRTSGKKRKNFENAFNHFTAKRRNDWFIF